MPTKPSPRRTSKAVAPKPAARHAPTGDARLDADHVAAFVRSLPQPSEREVAAWRAQYPDTYAASLAAQTRAALVPGDAWAWMQTARPVLEGELRARVRYPLQRLAFLGRNVLDLLGVLERERARKRSAEGLGTARTSAEALAQAALSELRSALRAAVGRHEALGDELDRRLGEKPSSDTAGQLQALAGLLEEWLGRDDAILQTLLETHRLTEADARQARESAAALTAAATAKRGVASSGTDTAEVSAVEGRVLVEMRALRNALLDARKVTGDARSPRLAPGAGTRAVFSRRNADADDGSDEPEPPAPPPEG